MLKPAWWWKLIFFLISRATNKIQYGNERNFSYWRRLKMKTFQLTTQPFCVIFASWKKTKWNSKKFKVKIFFRFFLETLTILQPFLELNFVFFSAFFSRLSLGLTHIASFNSIPNFLQLGEITQNTFWPNPRQRSIEIAGFSSRLVHGTAPQGRTLQVTRLWEEGKALVLL